jgi:hypothetical protein
VRRLRKRCKNSSTCKDITGRKDWPITQKKKNNLQALYVSYLVPILEFYIIKRTYFNTFFIDYGMTFSFLLILYEVSYINRTRTHTNTPPRII